MIQYLTKLSVRYADMPSVHFPARHSYLFPFDRGVCITLMLLIPISQADRPFISLGVSVKTQAWREVQMAQMATSEWNKFGS